jgi:ribonuclease HI
MIVIYTDSAVRGNPSDRGAWAFFVMKENGTLSIPVCEVKAGGSIPGKVTNNMAEYIAIIKALKYAKSTRINDFKLRSDSNLAINQILGLFKIKNSGLIPLYLEVRGLVAEIENVEFEWVPRENPWISRVDAYCNEILNCYPLETQDRLKLRERDF